MRVLVTGATGFVGKRLCQVLEAREYDVVRVARQANSPRYVDVGDIGPTTDWMPAMKIPVSIPTRGVECFEGAWPDEGRNLIPEEMSLKTTRSNGDGQVDAIVHLAARVHVMKEGAADPLAEFRRVNVEGTLNLARQAVIAGVKRFVYVSTIKVNGEVAAAARPFREDHPPAPQDAYAISKYEAEVGLTELAQDTGLEVVIVRPPLVYGPGVKGNFASLMKWVRKGVPLPFGAVHNLRSLVALDNLVDFVALCADRDKSPAAANQVFLISDGDVISTPGLLRKVALAYGTKPRLIAVPEGWLRMGARLAGRYAEADRLLDSLVIDISKAWDLLQWRPVVTMDQQLRMMVSNAEVS